MNKKVLSALIMGTAFAASNVMAYEAGDVVVRVGLANVDPHATNNTVVPGVDVEDETQIGITGTYMLTDHVGVELLASTPFKHNLTINGAKVGDTKHLPPTLSIQYFPMDSGSALQPYVGLGVNYTTFFSEGSAGALAGSDIKLDDSWGMAAQVGVDYAVNENWLVNAAVWKMDIDTDLELNGTNLGEVEIDPIVVMLSVGYKF